MIPLQPLRPLGPYAFPQNASPSGVYVNYGDPVPYFLPAGAVPESVTGGGPKTYRIPSWATMNDVQRVRFIRSVIDAYGQHPHIRKIAFDILTQAGVPERDYVGQGRALLAWVQQNIRYANEKGEIIQDPIYTINAKLGDCFPKDTLLLNDNFDLVKVQDLKEGDRIWGKDRWSAVEKQWAKGELPVSRVLLTNGSSFEVTEDHKVYVNSCEKHGPYCSDISNSWKNCEGRKFNYVRIPISELRPGMEILTPDRIDFGKQEQDEGVAFIEGLYVSDGWSQQSRFCISGKDGCPKEAQKLEVQAICNRLGVETTWNERYISVRDSRWGAYLKENCGEYAPEKRVPSLNLAEPALRALLRGVMADSGKNTHGTGRTFTTTSRMLFLQTRIMQKMCGKRGREAYIENHGGLGKNPIWRLIVPGDASERKLKYKRLRVESIERNVRVAPCYDITTDDHYVYLPEADVTVSNCDDMAVVFCALAESIHLPTRLVISGTDPRTKKTVRWIEGIGFPQPGVKWAHIYAMVGNNPFKPTGFAFVEPTLKVPFGWDVVQAHDGKVPMPELGAAGDVLQRKKWYEDIDWKDVRDSVIKGAVTALVLQGFSKVWKK